MLVDSHTHLYFEHFHKDLPAVLERARAAGVGGMLLIGIDAVSCAAAVQMAAAHPGMAAAVGVHPNSAADFGPAVAEQLVQWAAHPRVRAIGEIGLDYHWNRAPHPLQQEIFRRQIRLAQRVGLPIIIHSRAAHDDTIRILVEEEAAALGVVMHCFAGDCRLAARCLELGFVIGLGGPVTFKNAVETQAVARMVPLDRLLVETDCPFLAPAPHRGRRNEPAYVRLVAERIAALRGVAPEVVAAATTANAQRLFGIELDASAEGGGSAGSK